MNTKRRETTHNLPHRTAQLLTNFSSNRKALDALGRLSADRLKEIKDDLDNAFPGDEQISNHQLQRIYVTADSELQNRSNS